MQVLRRLHTSNNKEGWRGLVIQTQHSWGGGGGDTIYTDMCKPNPFNELPFAMI